MTVVRINDWLIYLFLEKDGDLSDLFCSTFAAKADTADKIKDSIDWMQQTRRTMTTGLKGGLLVFRDHERHTCSRLYLCVFLVVSCYSPLFIVHGFFSWSWMKKVRFMVQRIHLPLFLSPFSLFFQQLGQIPAECVSWAVLRSFHEGLPALTLSVYSGSSQSQFLL